jgi:nucleotide-binding universal stress UspA family protein
MKCLLAVHLHERAEELLEQGVAWAQRMGATLDVAYVDEYNYDLMLIDDPSVRTVLDHQWAEVRQRQAQRLAELVASIPAEQRGEGLALAGRPADELVRAGADHDVIIVGTHGRTGIGHLLLGSVAERVVRTASTPVLVLRLDEEA